MLNKYIKHPDKIPGDTYVDYMTYVLIWLSSTKDMNRACNIVSRAHIRVENGGKLLPRNLADILQTTSELEQESRDAKQLQKWEINALNEYGIYRCCDEVKMYLDSQLLGWRPLLHFEYTIKRNQENWTQNFNLFIEFVTRYSCLPTLLTNDILCYWYEQQQFNYKTKKNSMEIQEQYELWTQVLNTYNFF